MTVWAHLDDYQQHAVRFCCERSGAAVFAEQGTGKTWILAGVIEHLIQRYSQRFVGLVVVPLANIETTWARTLREQLPQLTVSRSWDDFKRVGHRGLLLVHYEALPKIIKRLQKREWHLIAYDESQRLKARGTKASRTAKRFQGGDHRVILSGTPIEQAPQDLWAQFRFCLPHVLGTVWEDFKLRWLKETGYMGYELKFRMELLPKFLKLIEPHILRVKKADVLDLPPMRLIRAPVELLGQQRRVYDDLDRDMVTEVDGRTITADLAITELVRLQQVCGGFVRTDPTEDDRAKVADTKRKPKGKVVYVGQAKAAKLRSILRREVRPTVIFCKYKEELQQIIDAISEGERVGIIRGKLKKHRTATVEAFQRGEIDVLVCQIRAGGVGLDLQRACVAIVYSTTFSFIDFDQAIARLHRRGQTQPVRIWLIFARNTVDELIYEAIVSKQLVSEQVLNRRRTMAKKDKGEKPAATETKTDDSKKKGPPQPEKPKYGVPELAEALGIKPASVRVRLRNAEVPKKGKLYGWDTKAEMQAVIDQLQPDEDEKKDEKPAKK
jgi:SNF2 family DNA or RNA helicase